MTGALINTMIGSKMNDQIGFFGITILANGNFVVSSPGLDNGAIADAGAVTLCSAATDCPPTISPANSLVGSTMGEGVGAVTALPNGKYVVITQGWDNGVAENAGAVTLCDAAAGCTGTISASNSLVGLTAGDSIGTGTENSSGVKPLTNGNYVVLSRYWDYIGGFANLGAVTGASGSVGVTGAISSSNSALGLSPDSGLLTTFVFDSANNQIIVGHQRDNEITLSRPFAPTAANISISGKVVNGKTGVPGALVTLTDSEGNVWTAKTNSFGYFKFEDLRAGQTLIINVTAKGLVFNPQVIFAMEDITDLLFTAQ
jgi:hypothetical protein